MGAASLPPCHSPLGLGPPRAQSLTSAQPILPCGKAAASAGASQGPNRALAGQLDHAGAPAAPKDTMAFLPLISRDPGRKGGRAVHRPEARRMGSGGSRRSRHPPCAGAGARPPGPARRGGPGGRSRRGIPGVRQGAAALCRLALENSVCRAPRVCQAAFCEAPRPPVEACGAGVAAWLPPGSVVLCAMSAKVELKL